MSRFTLIALTFAFVASASSFNTAQAGGCSKGGYKKSYNYKSYGRNDYGYKKDYHRDYDRHYVRPVHKEVIIEKPVIVEKPIYIERPVIQEVHVEEVHVEPVHCPLPSLGFYGVVCPEGMLVKEVSPNSEACRLGLAPGDVIRKFDEIRIICDDDWDHALKCAGDVGCLEVIPCGAHEIVTMHAQLACGVAR